MGWGWGREDLAGGAKFFWHFAKLRGAKSFRLIPKGGGRKVSDLSQRVGFKIFRLILKVGGGEKFQTWPFLGWRIIYHLWGGAEIFFHRLNPKKWPPLFWRCQKRVPPAPVGCLPKNGPYHIYMNIDVWIPHQDGFFTRPAATSI